MSSPRMGLLRLFFAFAVAGELFASVASYDAQTRTHGIKVVDW